MSKNYNNLQLWSPERFFYSHATQDNELTLKVQNSIKKINDKYEVYVAERKIVGKPLIEKLRTEMFNCNAVIVGWTKNTRVKKTSQVISFELGLAYSLSIPIYILRFNKAKMPWFYDKITDYVDISSNGIDEIKNALIKIEPYSFLHPIELVFPKEPYNKYNNGKNYSENSKKVSTDGQIRLEKGFDGLLHFNLINQRNKPEKYVRIIIKFPNTVTMSFNPGSLNGSSLIQRNEIFYMRETPTGTLRIDLPSLPIGTIIFQIKLRVPNNSNYSSNFIEISISSESIIGLRNKKIPIDIID